MDYKITAENMSEMEELYKKLISDPSSARDFVNIDACVRVSAKNIGAVKALIRLAKSGELNDRNGSMNIIKRFFNETDGFIHGQKRVIRTMTWAGMIEDALREFFHESYQGDNVGSSAFNLTRNCIKAPASKSIMHLGITDGLINTPNHEIVHSWMMRENGIDDMVVSLYIMMRILRETTPL